MGARPLPFRPLNRRSGPTTQLEQIALFNKLVDKFEIILDSDPRNTTLRGQEQPAGT